MLINVMLIKKHVFAQVLSSSLL